MPKNDLQCPFSTATVGYSFSKDFCGGNYVLQTCGNIAAIQRQICRAWQGTVRNGEICQQGKHRGYRFRNQRRRYLFRRVVDNGGVYRRYFCKNLSTFNNFVFTLPLHSLDEIGCLLVKREDDCYEVAQGQYGTQNLTNVLRRNIRSCEDNSTPYEKFVASTENFYEGADVEKLKADADGRYKSVEEYSNAFERYYAAGGQDNYYQSVKREIGKVFLQFPPYYPLIRKYRESFFVRIDFPSSEKYFVLGLLQQEGKIRYICYGLPAEKEGFSDKDFVFVNNAPTNFWMLFQDADSGQITTLTQPV